MIGLVTGGGVDQWVGSLGGIAESGESELDVTLSSQSSDHPLRDPALLDKLIYTHPSVSGVRICSLKLAQLGSASGNFFMKVSSQIL